jgi:hypothetical protein
MKKYAGHNTGGWIRNPRGYGDPIREPATVQEFDDFEDMHPFDRAQFIWMLEHGEIVITTGTMVYQIRKTA